MPTPMENTPNPTAASFTEHLAAFHDRLPVEEQLLLEQIVEIAAAVAGGGEVQGYAAVDYFLKIDGILGENRAQAASKLHEVLNSPIVMGWDVKANKKL